MQEQITMEAKPTIRKDITGLRFGRLEVLYCVSKHPTRKKDSLWMCRCSCGKEKSVPRSSLNAGAQSCGCLRMEKIKQPRRPYPRLSDVESGLRRYTHSYATNAKRRGFDFALNSQDIEALAFGNCFYCELRPMLQARRESRNKWVKTDIFLNGIDRIDSLKGYVPGNVVSCCTACNRAKSDMSVEVFLEWLDRVHQRYYTILNRISAVREVANGSQK